MIRKYVHINVEFFYHNFSNKDNWQQRDKLIFDTTE